MKEDGGRKADTPGSIKCATSRLKVQEITLKLFPTKEEKGWASGQRCTTIRVEKDYRVIIVDTIREVKKTGEG